jgi:hypothetical protein
VEAAEKVGVARDGGRGQLDDGVIGQGARRRGSSSAACSRS